MQQPRRAFEGRSTFVDALRGIAALSVACYHIFRYGPLPIEAAKVVPVPLQLWFDHGWIGVQVFFVISGFVIAYSVRDALITPGYVANYALRRSIRLDPPYWVTIGFVLLVHWVFSLSLGYQSPMDVPEPMEPEFSWKVLLAHVLYVQNILRYENLSAGFWTLSIEVQFYLLYVIGLGIAQRIPERSKLHATEAGPIGLLGLFAPLAVLSLFVWALELGAAPWRDLFMALGMPHVAASDPGQDFWITHFFCMFFLGCSAWWALDSRIPPAAFWGYVGLVVLRLAISSYLDLRMLDLLIALVTGVAIYVLGRRGWLGTALNYRWLQYLGRISYSLYLIHFPVAHIVTTLGEEHMTVNNSLNPWAAAGWLLAALVASIVAAHGLFLLIEAPSVKIAAQIKRIRPSEMVENGPSPSASERASKNDS